MFSHNAPELEVEEGGGGAPGEPFEREEGGVDYSRDCAQPGWQKVVQRHACHILVIIHSFRFICLFVTGFSRWRSQQVLDGGNFDLFEGTGTP